MNKVKILTIVSVLVTMIICLFIIVPIYQTTEMKRAASQDIAKYFKINKSNVHITKINLLGSDIARYLHDNQVWNVSFKIKNNSKFSGPGFCEFEKSNKKIIGPIFSKS